MPVSEVGPAAGTPAAHTPAAHTPAARTPAVPLVAAVLAAGAGAGIVGVVMVELLRVVQWIVYGRWSHELVGVVSTTSTWRRVLVPVVAAVACGLAWWWVRSNGRLVGAQGAIREGRRMNPLSSAVDAGAQVVLVGAGASLGREGAPRELSAAGADVLAHRLRLASGDRAHLVAAAAGAGLAAVYVTPLAGAAFALEVVLRRRSWGALALALPVSLLGVVVASPVVGHGPSLAVPAALTTRPDAHVLGWSLLAALVALPVGLGFARVTSFVAAHRPRPGVWLVAALVLAGAVTGLVEVVRPEVAGNGRDLVELALLGTFPLTTALVLVAAKAALTAGHLGAGAAGGLLMPSLAVGAATGVAVALAGDTGATGTATLAWCALAAGVVVLTATQRAPLFASLFAWELTRAHWSLLVLAAVVAVATHGVHEWARRRAARTVGAAR